MIKNCLKLATFTRGYYRSNLHPNFDFFTFCKNIEYLFEAINHLAINLQSFYPFGININGVMVLEDRGTSSEKIILVNRVDKIN